MRRFLPFTLINLLCLTASLTAFAEPGSRDYDFQAADGSRWIRHILVESGETRRLLLVVDEPLDGRMQKVSFRKSFGIKNEKAFHSAIAQWKNPVKHLNADFFSLRALTPSHQPLWPLTHQWDQAAENDYNNWVATNVTTDMLRGGGVKVDCADFAMTIRWLYARAHGLPAGNSLAGGGHLQGSWESTDEWDQLPTDADWKKDERFKAALRYMLENSYTHTVVDDLYPVEITKAYVKAGTIYLTFHGESGHTRTYLAIGQDRRCGGRDVCFVQIYGNEPKADEGYIQTYEVPRPQPEGKGGLMRFRWPVADAQGNWRLTNPKQMPGYSHEQYDWDPSDFQKNLYSRLALYGSKEQRVAAEGQTLIGLINQRREQVQRGYFLCSIVPCAPGSDEDEAWSTWNRDARLVQAINQFRADLKGVNQSETDIENLLMAAQTTLVGNLTYWDVMTTMDTTLWKSDPTLPVEQRWGFLNLSASELLNLRIQAFGENFYGRYDLVFHGRQDCVQFKTNGDCSKGSELWKKYETSRYDSAFRLALQGFSQLYKNLQEPERSIADLNLKEDETNFALCGSSGRDACTLYELLVAHPEHIEKMTSEPTDTEANRWGF